VTVITDRPQQPVHAGGDDRQPPCRAFCTFISSHFRFTSFLTKMKFENGSGYPVIASGYSAAVNQLKSVERQERQRSFTTTGPTAAAISKDFLGDF